MNKKISLMVSAFLLLAIAVGCTSDDDTFTPTVSKVTIIDPIGYARNMEAWIPATNGGRTVLLLEEGHNYMLGTTYEPASILEPTVKWSITNSGFEEATVSAQGIITAVKEDPDNANECLVTATVSPNVTDVIEIKVLKELSCVYEITNDKPEIVLIDGGSIRSTSHVTSALNASGKLNNKDLITCFFSDKNRANFNDAATITITSGTSFDIQGNGTGVNILMAYSKAYLSEDRKFEDVRDYTVLVSTNRRQANMADSSFVSLNKHNEHVTNGTAVDLSATITRPNATKPATVQYASSNPKVATVDKATGKVTAVGKGLATITAYANSMTESQYCVVNVDEAIPVAVTRIVDVNDFTTAHTVSRSLIVKGQTQQLYADHHENETKAATGVEWSSSDKSVVTVDNNGKVTAVGVGNAVIYCTPYVEQNGVKTYGIADCGSFTVMPDYTGVKVGDIFYSDGSFSKEVEAGKTPVGIVAYLNKGVNDFTEKAELAQYAAVGADKNVHGLVLSLKDAATGKTWGKDTKSTGLVGVTVTKDTESMKGSATVGNYSGFSAAICTNAEDVVTGSPTFKPAESYPASYAGWNYDVKVLPSYVTNWFVPSVPQWYAILFNGLGGLQEGTINPQWDTDFNASSAITAINSALKKLNAAPLGDGIYWSANEGDNNGTTAAAMQVAGGNAKFTAVNKTTSAQTVVRTVFAF